MGINVVDFEKDLERFEQAMADDIVDAKKALAIESVKSLAEKSPVLTGTYIYNHRVSTSGSQDASFIRFPQMPGDENPVARAEKKAVMGNEMVLRETMKIQGSVKFASGDVRITNTAPHAEAVEFGSSRLYAPFGVYNVTHSHLETVADGILAKIKKRVV